jgi:drug/metabolite transporter (DMT)-like permease
MAIPGDLNSIPRVGELAALLTSLLWVGSSLAFSAAGRRTSVTTINLLRCLVAVMGLWIAFVVLHHAWFPSATWRDVILLGASGVCGLAIGDQLLFSAFVSIGARLSMLIMTTVPIMAAALAVPVLGETLPWTSFAGMAVTLSGIAWVVAERPERREPDARSLAPIGVMCAVGAAACQAVGMVLARKCLSGRQELELAPLTELPAQVIRMSFGAAGVIVVATVVSLRGRTHLRAGLPRALPFILMGALAGPMLGVYCSLVAVHHASTGVATTLMSLTPVFILPFAVLIEKERLSARAIVGAAIAVVGVALLTLDLHPVIQWIHGSID